MSGKKAPVIEGVPACITHVETMSKSIRIHVDTQETLAPETLGKIFGLKDRLGWFFFAERFEGLPQEIDAAKLPPITLEEGERSPSQRLRGAFFVYWDKNVSGRKNDPYGVDFELYYRQQMEKLIGQVKERLT
jgi:hypothetical protein